MYTIKRRLVVLAIVLFFTLFQGSSPSPLEFSKTLPIEKTLTVSKLMTSESSSDRFGLVDYFRKLKLDDSCKSLVLTIDECKKLILDNTFNPCLCTTIYNVTKELKANFLNTSDQKIANIDIAHFKTEDSAMYEYWKTVSSESPSLKLFMDLLEEKNWKKFCYNPINNNLTRYCKFLNFEILLWYNVLPKSYKPIKETINIGEDTKNTELNITNISIPEEQKKDEILKIDAEEDDARKNINVDNNDEELSGGNYNNKDEETTNEDNLQDKQMDSKKTIISSETKLLDETKSSNDYPNAVDGTINQSEAKEPQSRFSQGLKKTFTNHEFGDVEDSHFLFYFGIMTVLSMLFYLALYNKKKIIALLIEGRRSTNHRRRPNTASYSKVETDDGTTVF